MLYIGSCPRLIRGVPSGSRNNNMLARNRPVRFVMRISGFHNLETLLTDPAQRSPISTAYLFFRIDPITIKRKKIFHTSHWMTIKLLQYVIMRKDLISSGNKSSVFSIGAFVAQGMIAVFYLSYYIQLVMHPPLPYSSR